MTYLKFWRINAVILIILVGIVSLTPNTDDLDPALSLTAWLAKLFFGDPTSKDKVAHFLAYGAMGVFITLGWGRTLRDLGGIALFLILYGLLMEILQLAIGTRSGDVMDLLANCLGGFSGMAGALLMISLFQRFTLSHKLTS